MQILKQQHYNSIFLKVPLNIFVYALKSSGRIYTHQIVKVAAFDYISTEIDKT